MPENSGEAAVTGGINGADAATNERFNRLMNSGGEMDAMAGSATGAGTGAVRAATRVVTGGIDEGFIGRPYEEKAGGNAQILISGPLDLSGWSV